MNSTSHRAEGFGSAGCGSSLGCIFVLVWLLILPLPGPMARARERLYLAGSEDANAEKRPNYFADHAQGTVRFSGPARLLWGYRHLSYRGS